MHIPYKGTPEALTDTMTGRVTYFFSPISAALPNAEGQAGRPGRQHGEAVERVAERADDRRERPPGFDYNLWVGMFAPAGTPADIVDKINRDVGRVLQTPEVKERLAALGAEAMPMSPAEFRKFVRDEIDDSGKVIKGAGIKVQ